MLYARQRARRCVTNRRIMKLIPLTQNKFAIVDSRDYENLSQFKWYAHKKYKTWYARRNLPRSGKNRKSIFMHRYILSATPSRWPVDHKNSNGLDNRRDNLRLCKYGQHNFNKSLQCNSGTGYKGVYKRKMRHISPYQATIKYRGKVYYLGCYKTPKEAAIAYDNAAKIKFGGFAKLNFG